MRPCVACWPLSVKNLILCCRTFTIWFLNPFTISASAVFAFNVFHMLMFILIRSIYGDPSYTNSFSVLDEILLICFPPWMWTCYWMVRQIVLWISCRLQCLLCYVFLPRTIIPINWFSQPDSLTRCCFYEVFVLLVVQRPYPTGVQYSTNDRTKRVCSGTNMPFDLYETVLTIMPSIRFALL